MGNPVKLYQQLRFADAEEATPAHLLLMKLKNAQSSKMLICVPIFFWILFQLTAIAMPFVIRNSRNVNQAAVVFCNPMNAVVLQSLDVTVLECLTIMDLHHRLTRQEKGRKKKVQEWAQYRSNRQRYRHTCYFGSSGGCLLLLHTQLNAK